MNPRKNPGFRIGAPGGVPEVVFVLMIAEATRAGDSANKGPARKIFQNAIQGEARPWIFTGKSAGLLVRHRACNVCRPSGFGVWFRDS